MWIGIGRLGDGNGRGGWGRGTTVGREMRGRGGLIASEGEVGELEGLLFCAERGMNVWLLLLGAVWNGLARGRGSIAHGVRSNSTLFVLVGIIIHRHHSLGSFSPFSVQNNKHSRDVMHQQPAGAASYTLCTHAALLIILSKSGSIASSSRDRGSTRWLTTFV